MSNETNLQQIENASSMSTAAVPNKKLEHSDCNSYILLSMQEVQGSAHLTDIIEDIYSELCDDVIFGLILQVHRASKLGYLFYLQPDDSNDESKFKIFENNDVIGVYSHLNTETNHMNKSQTGRGGNSSSASNNNSNYNSINKYECLCPSCDRNVAAIRFAPHLEKCMGMGRNSSRIATRRIANYAGDELDQLIEATGYISNYSTNYGSNGSGSKSQSLVSSNYISSESTSVSTTNEINGAVWTKTPTAKKLKTKTSQKVSNCSSPTQILDTAALNSVNSAMRQSGTNEDTTSQEAELVKLSGPGFSSVYSSVSISPSPNSSSSVSSGSSSVLSSNTTITNGPTFVEPIREVPCNNTLPAGFSTRSEANSTNHPD